MIPPPTLFRIPFLERQPQTQARNGAGELPQYDAFSLPFRSLSWVRFSRRGGEPSQERLLERLMLLEGQRVPLTGDCELES